MGAPTAQNRSSCKTAAVMNLLGKGPAAEKPVPVQQGQVRDIEVITREILDAKRIGGEAILTIGRGLIEAKAQLSHGEWLRWLEERVEFSERAAQRFMLLAKKYSNPTTLSDFGMSKALILLALPDETRDEYIESTHIVGGEEKTVADMTTRELKTLMRERDEALKAAEQARAEQAAAEQAREKISQDMALANERIEGLNAEAEEYAAKAREAEDCAAKAQEAAARLEKELEALRSRPVEVAVEADSSAIEAARKEAEAAMRDELDKAKKAQAKAEQDRKADEEARDAARRDLDLAKAEAQAAREQAELAEKRAALASSKDLALFQVLFDQAQDVGNKMVGVLLKVRPKDPDKAKGLERALLAWTGNIQEVVRG